MLGYPSTSQANLVYLEKEVSRMGRILWLVIVVLIVIWLLGFLLDFGGGLIHTLLIIAGIIFVIQLVMGKRSL